MNPVYTVTGAFSYTGQYIAARLLDEGAEVRTLTNHAGPVGGIKTYPLNFEHPERLEEAMRGSSVLFNTYWIRYERANLKFAQVVENTRRLFEAARKADVQRIVHISVTQADAPVDIPYHNAKHQAEQLLADSGIPYSILRPALIFGGRNDIIINDLVWALRHVPVMGIARSGAATIQPVFVEDLAKLAVEEGREQGHNIINALGPDQYTYREFISTVAKAAGCRRPIMALPAFAVLTAGKLIGAVKHDVVVTPDEIRTIRANLLNADTPPNGAVRLADWVAENRDWLGRDYISEMALRKLQG